MGFDHAIGLDSARQQICQRDLGHDDAYAAQMTRGLQVLLAAARVECRTVGDAKTTGLSLCSGAIFGMGESDDDIIDVALALRELQPDSVPVNFLIPFQGTPLDKHWELTRQRCLRILAMFRFAFPNVEVRIAGGREYTCAHCNRWRYTSRIRCSSVTTSPARASLARQIGR
jgi:hypothetical protein